MKPTLLVNSLFLFFVGSLFAQKNFSAYVTMNTQPTENIKMNETIFGADYTEIFSSKFKLKTNVVFDSKHIHYYGAGFSNTFLNVYQQLKTELTFSYTKNPTYQYQLKIAPFIANEKELNFSSLYVLGSASIAFKLAQKQLLTLGLANTAILGKPALLPLFSYEYKFNDKLNVAVGFPDTKISYSNNVRNIFALKNEFNGSFYSLSDATKAQSATNKKSSFSQITSSVEYERNLETNWFVNFKAGYDFNRKYLLLDQQYNTTFDFNIEDGYHLGITIKYKY
jgi:hypothetical protein